MTFLPILKTESENLPRKILVVGDPNRIDEITKLLTSVEPISENREYRSIKGKFNGQVIGVVSHGVGSAGAGACFEELCQDYDSQLDLRLLLSAGLAGICWRSSPSFNFTQTHT